MLVNAQELARATGNERVESVHLLLGALQIEPPDAQLGALLQISGLKPDEVRLYAQSALESKAPLAPDALLKLSDSVRRTMQLAGKEASRTNCELVDISHIFVACFRPQREPGLAEVLAPLGVSADQLSLHLRQLSRGEAEKAIANQSPLAQLTQQGERALDAAHAAMRASFCGRISTLHLLIGILGNRDGDAVAALQTMMINVEELRARANAAQAGDGEIAGPSRRFTPAAKRALDRAEAAAREGGRSTIGDADLLMGLLPQPTLLIERAQFGARPDDPAAPILRDVDADLVRAIFNPQQANTPIVITPKSATEVSLTPFWFLFSIQLALGVILKSVSWSSSQTRTLAAVLMLLLVGSGLVAATAQLIPRAAPFKTTLLLAFGGALIGAMAAMYIAR